MYLFLPYHNTKKNSTPILAFVPEHKINLTRAFCFVFQVEALFQTNSSSHDFNNKPMRTTQPPTLSSFYQSLITKTLSSVSPDGKSVASDLLKMQSATVLLDKLETNHLPQVFKLFLLAPIYLLLAQP